MPSPQYVLKPADMKMKQKAKKSLKKKSKILRQCKHKQNINEIVQTRKSL